MTKRKVEQQPKLKLLYFNIKGKAEAIRLFCAYAGLELEDYRFANRDEFNQMKNDGVLSFGQVPLLEVDGKHQLVQSGSILRYLAKISNLYPEDPIVAAKVDSALDQTNDAFLGATVVTYGPRFGISMDDATKEAARKAIGAEIMPRHLGHLEKLLEGSPNGWIAGTEEPSPADFVWFSKLVDYIPDNPNFFPESLAKLEGYPKCQAFVEKFKALPAYQEYYAGKE